MWWAGSQRCDAYIGTRRLAISVGAAPTDVEPVDGMANAISALRRHLAEQRTRLSLRIWLSGSLCRPFILDPVAGVKSAAEWRRLAKALANERTGFDGECLVWTAAAQGGKPSCAAVVERATLDAVLAMTRDSRRVDVLSVAPWWSAVLREAIELKPGLQAIAIEDCDAITLLGGSGEGIDIAATAERVSGGDSAHQILTRLLLGADLDPGAQQVVRMREQPMVEVKGPGRRILGDLVEAMS